MRGTTRVEVVTRQRGQRTGIQERKGRLRMKPFLRRCLERGVITDAVAASEILSIWKNRAARDDSRQKRSNIWCFFEAIAKEDNNLSQTFRES